MTPERLSAARTDLDRAIAARRAAADVWARSRDLLDLGPLFDAIHTETAAADNYHFSRELEHVDAFYQYPR